MLVLNRNEGERILFYLDGEPLGWVSVEEVKGGQVRLGFELPQRVRIVREEMGRRYGPPERKGADRG